MFAVLAPVFVTIFLDLVLEAPFFYVDGKHVFVNQAPAEGGIGNWIHNGILKAFEQTMPDPSRNFVRMAGINVAIEDHRPEQDFPVLADEFEDAVPVKRISCGIDEMCYIGAVESFTPRNKDLRRNQFFRRKQWSLYANHFTANRAVYPTLLHLDNGVAHASDEVNEVAVSPGFAQPDGISDLGIESGCFEVFQRRQELIRSQKEVKVFCVSPYS